jgi:predicted component of type VI protein secretion system
MSVPELEDILKKVSGNTEILAQLQPILDAKRKLAELDSRMKQSQKAMDDAGTEESRIRRNIDALKGSAEEKPLAKRYADAMIAQEDKLAILHSQHEADQQQRDDVERALTGQVRGLTAKIDVPAI